jgi:UDP-N-acetylmuramate dehydrogenase
VRIEAQVALAERTTMGVGGYAAHYARAESEADLREALAWANAQNVDVRVLGGGSNIVVADAGFPGLVIETAMCGISATERDGRAYVRAAAGEPWDAFVADMVRHGYQGVECLSGIPGRVGATPIQNVGAYGQDVSETIESLRAWDRETDAARTFRADECQFAYRDSFFKAHAAGRYVVTEVTFRLRLNAPPAIRYAELQRHFAEQDKSAPSLAEVRETVIQLRRSKSMVLDASDPNSRSCGSFFLNPVLGASALGAFLERASGEAAVPQFPQPDGSVKLSAGWLIEHAGLPRGTRDGNVGLSSKHALAIVAYAGARAGDVLRFAEWVQRRVAERFGVRLEPEPVIWGAHG